jgi:1,4-alpha-glucan branching enzyme
LPIRPPSARRSGSLFDCRFHKGTKEVYLAGSFNNWSQMDHKMDGPDAEGMFSTRLTLLRGDYQYKFVVEGARWRSDPGNPRQVEVFNNNALIVGTP